MRGACFVLALLMVPTTQAVMVLEDPQGDVQVGPTPVGDADRWSDHDMVSLSIDETPTRLTMHLQLAGDGDESRVAGEEATYEILFRIGGASYRVSAWQFDSARAFQQVQIDAGLEQRVDGSWHFLGYLPAVQSGTLLSVDVPRRMLHDQNDVEPFAGVYLTDLRVQTKAWALDLFGEAPTDRMPDDGESHYRFQFGANQTGHVRLSAESRLRASNGVATTYLFRINATNTEDFEDELTLSVSGIPAPWDVRIPFPSMRVGANESVQFPVLLTVPFAHQHGVVETFRLEASSQADDASVGRLDLGVEYLATPQPAGHHDLLTLHTGRAPFFQNSYFVIGMGQGSRQTGSYMNTLPEDPRSTGEPVAGRHAYQSTAGDPEYGWVVPLDPTLRLGLDFRLDQSGTLRVPITSSLPLSEALMRGKLYLVDEEQFSPWPAHYEDMGDVRVLADAGPSEAHAIGAGGEQEFEMKIQARPDADLVPYAAGKELILVLHLRTSPADGAASQEPPQMLAGGTMRLPINEYHDVIDQKFAAPAFIQLRVKGQAEQYVAAGSKLLYNLTLQNDGREPYQFRLNVSGLNSAWLDFPAGTTVEAPAKGSVDIPVAVAPPADAAVDGDKADVIVQAIGVEDERMRGLVRLVATVDSVLALRDDTNVIAELEQENAKESPGIGFLPLVLLAVSVALLRRANGLK